MTTATIPVPATKLKEIRDLIDFALFTHIYDAANGEAPEADDPYLKAVADLDALMAANQSASDPDYLDRFPAEARPHCDRAYQDGYVDGVEAERLEHAAQKAAEAAGWKEADGLYTDGIVFTAADGWQGLCQDNGIEVAP